MQVAQAWSSSQLRDASSQEGLSDMGSDAPPRSARNDEHKRVTAFIRQAERNKSNTHPSAPSAPSCAGGTMIEATESKCQACADFALAELRACIECNELTQPGNGIKLALHIVSALATCTHAAEYLCADESEGCIGAMIDIICSQNANFCERYALHLSVSAIECVLRTSLTLYTCAHMESQRYASIPLLHSVVLHHAHRVPMHCFPVALQRCSHLKYVDFTLRHADSPYIAFHAFTEAGEDSKRRR